MPKLRLAIGGVAGDDVAICGVRATDRIAVALYRDPVAVAESGLQPADVGAKVVADDRRAASADIDLDGVVAGTVDD